jgi:diguanylate cyclase (GGDEF)-like protein
MDRMRKWVLGDYTIQLAATPPVKVSLDASIGVAQWQPGETIQQIIERADSAMYRVKKMGKHKLSLSAQN